MRDLLLPTFLFSFFLSLIIVFYEPHPIHYLVNWSWLLVITIITGILEVRQDVDYEPFYATVLAILVVVVLSLLLTFVAVHLLLSGQSFYYFAFIGLFLLGISFVIYETKN